ncbi:MAG: hypothetical protein P8X57_03230, partial [Cyclobacteriaceae bacterium]
MLKKLILPSSGTLITSCSLAVLYFSSCTNPPATEEISEIKANNEQSGEVVISKDQYHDKLYGFWLGECIANWTGLVT